MNIIDLQFQNLEIEISTLLDRNNVTKYFLSFKDAQMNCNYRMTKNEVKDLIVGTEQFLNKLNKLKGAIDDN